MARSRRPIGTKRRNSFDERGADGAVMALSFLIAVAIAGLPVLIGMLIGDLALWIRKRLRPRPRPAGETQREAP